MCDISARPRFGQGTPARRLLALLLVVVSAGCAAPASTDVDAAGTPTSSAAPGAGPDSASDPTRVPSVGVSPSPASRSAPDAGAAGPSVACDPIERPPLQAGSHLIGDRTPPVPYSSTPPTSGWHSSGHLHVTVRGARNPLTEPEQVSVLEAGGIVVAHGRLDPADRRRLATRVRDRHDGTVAVTPYRELPAGEVAFTGWGVLRRCDGVSLAALERFVERFGPDGPVDPGH